MCGRGGREPASHCPSHTPPLPPWLPHTYQSALPRPPAQEYINIELDAGRNRLIRLDIVLTAASFAIAPFNLLAGILGENLVIPPFLTTSVGRFWALNGCAFLCCFVFFFSIISYMRWRKLI